MTKTFINNKFDLEERTSKFSEEVIKFIKTINIDFINKPLIDQLIRSATSIGANYCEADDAESRRDFRHKIGICKKEAHESKYWLRALQSVLPNNQEINRLWNEAKELNLILNAIIISLDKNTDLGISH